jgi:hypothetical protein
MVKNDRISFFLPQRKAEKAEGIFVYIKKQEVKEEKRYIKSRLGWDTDKVSGWDSKNWKNTEISFL